MAFNFNVFFTIVGLTEYFIINIYSIDSQALQWNTTGHGSGIIYEAPER